MLPDPSLTTPHVGYAIGRPVGNAVTRNRVRRQVRALLAARADRLRPGWYVLGLTAAAASCTFQRLGQELDTLLDRLDARSGSGAPA